MSSTDSPNRFSRRRFLQAGVAAIATPWFIPASAIGLDGEQGRVIVLASVLLDSEKGTPV